MKVLCLNYGSSIIEICELIENSVWFEFETDDLASYLNTPEGKQIELIVHSLGALDIHQGVATNVRKITKLPYLVHGHYWPGGEVEELNSICVAALDAKNIKRGFDISPHVAEAKRLAASL